MALQRLLKASLVASSWHLSHEAPLQAAVAQLCQHMHLQRFFATAGDGTDTGSTAAASAPGQNEGSTSATAAEPLQAQPQPLPQQPSSTDAAQQQGQRSAVSRQQQQQQQSAAPSYGARLVQPLRPGGPGLERREGIIHVNNSLNNTIMVLTTKQGQVKAWASGGSVGYKNAAKASPLAAERAAAELARKALSMGYSSVSVKLKGAGKNKQYAVQALAGAGLALTQLEDVTPIAYNGCRRPRKRRL